MRLAISFMGLKLKNPIIIAAGPLTGSGEMMKKAIAAGAGAVVTKTIANEVRPNIRPRIYKDSYGLQNVELYSEFTLEEWQREIAFAKSHGAVVIANIVAQTPSELAYIAKRVEKFGADAIELGLSIPHGEGLEILVSDPNKLYDMVSRVVGRVKIPVMVKLSSNVTNLAKLAKAAEKAGASAISAIDTVRSIIGVDIDKAKTLLPTYGGYSGDAIRPIGLASVATIAQAVNIPVCGIGGISNYKNIIEYIMLGATTVQICSSIMLNGLPHIQRLKEDLEEWLDNKSYPSIDDIKGKALASLKSFDELKVEPLISQLTSPCTNDDCLICSNGCIYHAIKREKSKLQINQHKCGGCGLCSSICPEGKIKLIWP